MNRRLMLFFVILLVLTSVHAAQKFTIDFDQKNVYEVGMASGDAVEFNFKGSRHIVQVDEINFNASKVNLVSFLWADEHKQPYYNSIGNGNVLKLDFEVDDVPDIYVSVNKITPDAASIVFLKVSDAESVSASGFIDLVKHNRVYDLFILAFLGVVLLVILGLIFRRK